MFPSLLSLHTYNIVFIVKTPKNPVVIILIIFLCVPVTPTIASYPWLQYQYNIDIVFIVKQNPKELRGDYSHYFLVCSCYFSRILSNSFKKV